MGGAPTAALAHARTLAPRIVVLDHAPGSAWSWCAAEDGQVEAAWSAAEMCGILRRREHEAWQRFADYAALASKLSGQGAESRRRIEAYRGRTNISIRMPYQLALI